MRQAQNEKRIRSLWRGLPENKRQTEDDISEFTIYIRLNHYDLIRSVDSPTREYIKNVIDGLYKK